MSQKSKIFSLVVGFLVLGLLVFLFVEVVYYKEVDVSPDGLIENEELDDSGALASREVLAQRDLQARSLLNGEVIKYGNERRRVLGVVVENSLAARPQSGLSDADIVYETLVEGGITRFLAFFQGEDVEEIGPVRSVRPYFLDWLAEYDAVVVHDGGSKPALDLLWGSYSFIEDLAAGNFYDSFWRDNSRNVAWEHRLFTSSENLREVVESKEWEKWASPLMWSFDFDEDEMLGVNGEKEVVVKKLDEGKKRVVEKADVEGGLVGEKVNDGEEVVDDIVVDISTPGFKVNYEYDSKQNRYLRSMLGKRHLDGLSGEQLSPRTVVVLFTRINLRSGENPLGWVDVQTLGGGDALVFAGGEVIEGRWEKKKPKSRTRIFDENDEEIAFNPGQIWVHVVPDYRKNYVIF